MTKEIWPSSLNVSAKHRGLFGPGAPPVTGPVSPGKEGMREAFNAGLAMAQGDFASWKDHGKQLLARHGLHRTEEVVAWLCDELAVLSVHTPSISLEEVAGETVPFISALYDWTKAGFPHFSLTEDFFNAIGVTDFGDPTDEPVHMPFDAFSIAFPKSHLLGDTTRAFIYRVPSVRLQQGGYDMVWKLTRATLLTADPIFTQWPRGITRRELLDEASLIDSATVPGARPLDPAETPLTARLRTLLLNVMSYIESSGPLPTKARERSDAPAAVERLTEARPVFDVGRVVKLDGGLRQAMQASSGDKARWKLAQKFIVRGHWRMQAVGEGRAMRRRTWIAPFWKGPENVAEALSRTYAVE